MNRAQKVRIENVDGRDLSISIFTPLAPANIQVATKHLLAGMWLSQGSGKFSSRLQVRSDEAQLDQANHEQLVPVDMDPELAADAATILDFEFNCCSALDNGLTVPTLTANSLMCSSCTVNYGELPSQILTVQFKDSSAMRVNLDRMELGPDDEIRIDGGPYDTARLGSDSRLTYLTNGGYLHLNNKPINKTIWDVIPFEAKTGVLGFAIAAFGFRGTHIRRFVGRMIGRPVTKSNYEG